MNTHHSQTGTHPDQRDAELWEIARRRASFRSHLITYIIVNIFLWTIWYFSNGEFRSGKIPWPAWSTAGWGLGLLFHYLGAFVFSKYDSVEREYRKLKNEDQKRNQNI